MAVRTSDSSLSYAPGCELQLSEHQRGERQLLQLAFPDGKLPCGRGVGGEATLAPAFPGKMVLHVLRARPRAAYLGLSNGVPTVHLRPLNRAASAAEDTSEKGAASGWKHGNAFPWPSTPKLHSGQHCTP